MVWLCALILYGLFLAWYQNWRGPLDTEEIEHYMGALEQSTEVSARQREVLRRFLEQDDGREFLMLNLIRLAPEPVADPDTGELKTAAEILDGYTGPFLRALLRRGGHPYLLTRKVGGYTEAWDVAPDPGWTVAGYVRYRSRRDLMEAITAPAFAGAHHYKELAIPATFAFPAVVVAGAVAGPRVWAGLLLALLAALGSMAVLLVR